MRFKPTETATIAVAGIALVGSIVSAFYTYANRNRELDIKLVEIGISILRANPNEAQTNGAREWAIKVVETNSGQMFSAEAKRELLQNSLGWIETGYYRPSDPYYPPDEPSLKKSPAPKRALPHSN